MSSINTNHDNNKSDTDTQNAKTRSSEDDENNSSVDDDWIVVVCGQANNAYNKLHDAVMKACVEGNLTKLMSLETELEKMERYLRNACIVEAFLVSALENKLHMCSYLSTKYNVKTGDRRYDISSIFPFSAIKALLGNHMTSEIDPELLISCSKANCYDVVTWMINITFFPPSALFRAFESAMVNSSSRTCTVLYRKIMSTIKINSQQIADILLKVVENNKMASLEWFIVTDELRFYTFVPYIYTLMCRYGRVDGLSWLLNISKRGQKIKDVINRDVLSTGVVWGCIEGHLEVLTLHERIYSSTTVHSLLIESKDLENVVGKVLEKRYRTIIEWLNKIERFSVTVSGLTSNGEEVFLVETNNVSPDRCASDLLTKLPGRAHGALISRYVEFRNTRGKIEFLLNAKTLSDTIRESRCEIKNKDSHVDVLFDCAINIGDGGQPIETISVVIKLLNVISKDRLFTELCKSETLKDKNFFSRLIIDVCRTDIDGSHDMLQQTQQESIQQDNSQDADVSHYKQLMSNLVGFKINNNTDTSKALTHVYDTDCPSCFNPHELVLNCNHVICMVCAYTWYIKNKKEMICQTCRKSIDLTMCVCVI
ncbi:hypothetical protein YASMINEVIRUS_1455 [Yasminevirus sp. GU-2018]|uniref:RING-type domain-containing protein n=1 Tax=Yasminevirus sp. GU-2018 TaxID=2420051 RepID=A0A5K0UBE7_9VIRU|nr:hypothetical protein YASMINEVIRUS_1455 [Yasminevirus sp. GU-2018]